MATPVKRKFVILSTFEDRLLAAFGESSLKSVAARLGVNYHTLRNWAKETRDIPPSVLRQIAKMTNCSLNWLLLGDEVQRPDTGPKVPPVILRIAREQARTLFKDADFASTEAAVGKAVEIIVGYLLSSALHDHDLMTRDTWLLSDADIRLAERMDFVRDRSPKIEQIIRTIIRQELDDSAVLQPAEMILAPVVAHIEPGDDEEKRRTG